MSVAHPRESLRAEARRRGVTLATVRRDRALAAGLDVRTALGHAGPGEVPLSRRERRVVRLGGEGSPWAPIRLRGGGADADRAFRLLTDLHDLLSGDLAPAAWDARWKGRTFGGTRLPSAAEVLAEGQAGRLDLDVRGS
jgi:hypothetical protein